MPSPSGPRPPQIVLGDCHGRSSHPAIMTAIEDHFRRQGWRVARNSPYAGGHTTRRHGQPDSGIHAVQIEIDRQLYMDIVRFTPHAGFAAVADAFAGLATLLVARAPTLALAPALRDAAE